MKSKYQQKYKEIQTLGRGSFGVAYLVTPKKSKGRDYFVAKKVILSQTNKEQKAKSLLQAEILQKLNSPFVVKSVESFLQGGQLIVIMEYCEQGDLAFFIQNHKKRKQSISESIIANWFVQLCLGLRHIHSNKILHRDIKSSNIFLNSNGTVKIGDFGISKVLQTISQSAHTFTGTPYYLSPQVCSNLPYGYKSDIWALGCVMYQLCTLNYAFQAGSLLGLVRKIVEDKVQRIPKQYSSELSSVILKLLHKDVKYRPTIDQIFESQYIKKSMKQFVQCGGNLKIHVPVKGTTLHESIKNDIEQELPKNSIKLTPKQQAQRRKQIKNKQRQEQLLNATRQSSSTREWAGTRKNQDLYGDSFKSTKQQLVEVNEINKIIASQSYQKKNAQKQQAFDQEITSKTLVPRHDPNDNRPLPMTLKLQQQNQKFNQKQTPSKQQQQQDSQLQEYNDEDFEQYQEQDIRITSAADEKDLVKVSQIYSNQLNSKIKQTVSNQKQIQSKPSQSFLISLIEKKRKNLISQIGNEAYQNIYKFILKNIYQLQQQKLYSEIGRKYPSVNEQQIEQICQIVYIEGFKHTQ